MVLPSDHPPHACIERLLSHHPLQPYVHDIFYRCDIGDDTRYYKAFFKRHKRLPQNLSVWKSAKVLIRGDVAIMRANEKGEVVYDMSRGDAFRADLIIAR